VRVTVRLTYEKAVRGAPYGAARFSRESAWRPRLGGSCSVSPPLAGYHTQYTLNFAAAPAGEPAGQRKCQPHF
jgi:hypothetical protein